MTLDIHAVGLLACPVVAALAVIVSPRRKLETVATIWALIIPVLLAAVPATLRHHCNEGQPLTQWLVPLICLWVVFIGVGSARPRRVAAAGLTLAMYALYFDHSTHAHSDDYTGNRGWDSTVRAMARSVKRSITFELQKLGEQDSTRYAAGWLRDQPFAPQLGDTLEFRPRRGDAAPLWHSWFTGLFRRIVYPQDYWFPGGTLAEACDKIDVRDRSGGAWQSDH